MGRLHDLLEEHLAAQAYPVSQRRLATRLGVSPSTIDNWRRPRELVAKEHLVRIAQVTERPYREVLEALLFDIGYLHEDQEPATGSRGRRRSRDVETTAAQALRDARAAAHDREHAADPGARRQGTWDAGGESSA